MKPKQFFYLLCGLLALLIVGGGALYYVASQSLHTDTQQLSQKLADEQLASDRLLDLQSLRDRLQQLHTTDKAHPNDPPVYDAIIQALPATKEQTQLLVQLQSLANDSGIDLKSVTFAPSTIPGPVSQTVKAGDVLAIPVTLQLSGSYGQLQAFLTRQEHLNRYTSISSLTVAGSGNILTYGVQLNAYLKP